MDQKKIRFLKSLSTGLVIAAMVFAFLIAGIRLFGVQVYGVLTGSMEPSYPVGSLIYVRDAKPSNLRVNDVITFSVTPGVIATHRIVEIVPDESNPTIVRYRTKGDANRDVDASLVSANQIIGKAMFAVPVLGYVASFIQQSQGIYVAILVCGLLIAFVFYTESLDEKLKKQSEASEAPAVPEVGGAVPQSQSFQPDSINRQGYVPPQMAQQPSQQHYAPQQYPTMQNAGVPQQRYPQQQNYAPAPQRMPQRQYPPQYPRGQQGYYQQPVQQPAPMQYPPQNYYPQQSYPTNHQPYQQQMPAQQAASPNGAAPQRRRRANRVQ